LGDRKLMNSPGEQSNQYSRADNNNWNGTLTVNLRGEKRCVSKFGRSENI